MITFLEGIRICVGTSADLSLLLCSFENPSSIATAQQLILLYCTLRVIFRVNPMNNTQHLTASWHSSILRGLGIVEKLYCVCKENKPDARHSWPNLAVHMSLRRFPP